MGEIRGILLEEREKARLFEVADRRVWIPRSVTTYLRKHLPDAQGHRECFVEIDDWWLEKNEL